jgi:hypothetical protein
MAPERDLQEMDAIAAERGMVLAFRACDESDDFEPVFMRVGPAGIGGEDEVTLVAISDANGMSLGRYLIPRSKLDAALTESEDSLGADCSSADQLR